MSDKFYHQLPHSLQGRPDGQSLRKQGSLAEKADIKTHIVSLSNRTSKNVPEDFTEMMFNNDQVAQFEIHSDQHHQIGLPRVSSLQEQPVTPRIAPTSPRLLRQQSNRNAAKNSSLSNSNNNFCQIRLTDSKETAKNQMPRESLQAKNSKQTTRILSDSNGKDNNPNFWYTLTNPNNTYDSFQIVDFKKTFESVRTTNIQDHMGRNADCIPPHHTFRESESKFKFPNQPFITQTDNQQKRELSASHNNSQATQLHQNSSVSKNKRQINQVNFETPDYKQTFTSEKFLKSNVQQASDSDIYGFGTDFNSNSRKLLHESKNELARENSRIMKARPIKAMEHQSFEFGRPINSNLTVFSRVKTNGYAENTGVIQSHNDSPGMSKTSMIQAKYEKRDLSSNLHQIEIERLQTEIVNLKRALEAKDREKEKDLKMRAVEYEYKIKELEREKEFMASDLASKSNELISLKLKVSQYEKELEYLNQRNHKFKEKLALQSQETHTSELKDVTHFGRLDQQMHFRQNQKNTISESTDTFQPIKANYLDRIVTTQSSHVETIPTERVSYHQESRHTNDSMPNQFYQHLSPSYVGPSQLLSVLDEIVKCNQLDKVYSNKLECIITSIVDRESKGFPHILNDRRTTENYVADDQPSETDDKTEMIRKLHEFTPSDVESKRTSNAVVAKLRSSEVNGEELGKIGDRFFGSVNTFSKDIRLNTTFENQHRATTKIEEEITMMLKALRKQMLSATPISEDLEEMGEKLSLDLRTEFVMIINGLKELRKQLELAQNEAAKRNSSYDSLCQKLFVLSEMIQDPSLITKTISSKDAQHLQADFDVLYNKVVALGPIINELKENFAEGAEEELGLGVSEISRRLKEILELSFTSQKAKNDQTLRKKSQNNLPGSFSYLRDFDVSQKLVMIESFISEQFTRYGTLNEEYHKLAEQLADVRNELSDKVAERDAFQSRMQSYRELNEFLENEKAIENKELFNMRAINEDLTSQIAKLTADQNEKEMVIVNLKNELEAIREEYENVRLVLSKELPPDSNCDSIGLRRSRTNQSRKNSEVIGEDNNSEQADLRSFHFSNISHRQEQGDEVRVTVNSGKDTIRIDKSLINLEQLINLKAITSKSSLKKSQFVNLGGNPNTLLNEIEESSQLMHQANDHQVDPFSNSEYDPHGGDDNYGPILAEVVDENGNTIDIQIEAFIREIVESHKRKVEELEGELMRVKEMNSLLVAESSELKIINQKLKIETFKIHSLQRENQELMKMLEMYQHRQTELSTNSVNIKRLSEEIPEIQELQIGEGDSINYQKRESEPSNLNDLVDRLNARIEELTNEVIELREQNIELQENGYESSEHHKSSKNNISDSKARFSDKTIEDLKQLYEGASEEVERLRVLIGSKNNDMANLQSDFDCLQKEYEENRQHLAQNEEYNLKLTSRINELENQIKDTKKLRALVEAMRQSETLHVREAGILKKEIGNQKVQIKSYEDELDRLQTIISNWNQERNKYLDEILKLSQLSDKEKGGLHESRRGEEMLSPGFDADQIQRDLEAIQRKFSHY